jgi:hypothetical protein
MPRGGADARARQCAALYGLAHEKGGRARTRQTARRACPLWREAAARF